MKVQVAKRVYIMTANQSKGLLEIAKEQVSLGIYALEKKGYLEIVNMPMSRTELKKAKRELKKMGFKVYSNG